MDKKYIEYEKTIRDLEKLCVNGKMIGNDNSTYIDFTDAIDTVAKQPSAEVQPVKYGLWLKEYLSNGKIRYRCSVCNGIFGEDMIIDFNHNRFCSDCGAKMKMKQENWEC